MFDIFESFEIPSSCKIDKKLHKKQFLENFSLKGDEKRALKESVESISLKYLLNSKNINIQSYTNDEVDYSEVAYIHLELSNDKQYKKIAKIVQKIPYMVVLIISYHDKFVINICTKRINQHDKTKLIVEEEYFSPWIEQKSIDEKESAFLQSLKIKNQSFSNFKHFYHDILDKLIAFNLSKECISSTSPKATNKEALAKILTLKEQIKELKNKIKKETHFNQRVVLNIELKKLHDELHQVMESV